MVSPSRPELAFSVTDEEIYTSSERRISIPYTLGQDSVLGAFQNVRMQRVWCERTAPCTRIGVTFTRSDF